MSDHPYGSRRSYLTTADRRLFALAIGVLVPAWLFGFPYFVLALFAGILLWTIVHIATAWRYRPPDGAASSFSIRRLISDPKRIRHDRTINPGD